MAKHMMNLITGSIRIGSALPGDPRRSHRCLAFESLETRRALTAVNIPVDLTGEPSEQVVVPVEISDAEGVRGVEIAIDYDTELLDAGSDSVTAGSVWTAGSAEVVASVDDEAGTIVVWVFAAEGLDSGGGSLVEVAFTLSSDCIAGSATEIDLAEVVINGGAIPIDPEPQSGNDSTDGRITIDAEDEPSTVLELGQVDFTTLESIDPSAGELWFSLEAAYDAWLTVQAVETSTAGELAFSLYETTNLDVPVASSSLQDEKPRLDFEAQQGETYLIQVKGAASDASLLVANLVHETDTAVTVYGTDEADVFVFTSSPLRTITINGVAYSYEDTEVSTIDFEGGDGRDVVWLYDSAGDESLEAGPDQATLVNGANDSVPDYLVGVSGIEDLLAYATSGGTDSAVFHGSEGADKLKSYEDSVRLRAMNSSYTLRAKRFDTVVCDSGSSGSDLAVFNGSDGAETFTYSGSKSSARVQATDRDDTAIGFSSIIARGGSDGGDLASLTDVPDGDNVFYFRSHKTVLSSESIKVTVRLYDEVHATASGEGFNVARIYDTSGDDYLEVAGDTAKLYGLSGTELNLLYEASGFDRVKAFSSSGGDDTSDVGDYSFDLYLEGWDE